MKIAPTLQTMVASYNSIRTVSGRNQDGEKMRKELRALLAVARWAKRDMKGFRPCTKKGCRMVGCKLVNALARVSAPEKGEK